MCLWSTWNSTSSKDPHCSSRLPKVPQGSSRLPCSYISLLAVKRACIQSISMYALQCSPIKFCNSLSEELTRTSECLFSLKACLSEQGSYSLIYQAPQLCSKVVGFVKTEERHKPKPRQLIDLSLPVYRRKTFLSVLISKV